MRIAWRGNLDFSMGIVFNSGLQVALFITAAAVLAGQVVGHDVLVVFPPSSSPFSARPRSWQGS